ECVGEESGRGGGGLREEGAGAEVTAVSLFQATMAVPGRVIPRDREIEDAIWTGERAFNAIGCATCHVPALPLTNGGWIYSEPNPFNPPGDVSSGRAGRVALTGPPPS